MKTATMLVAALLGAAGLSGCSWGGVAMQAVGVARLASAAPAGRSSRTPHEAYLLGKVAAQQLLSNHPIYEDEAATRYLNQLGQALAMLSEAKVEPYRGFRFAILDTPDLNAYATPGAFVFVTRGLLRACASEEELAAVLAHEVAHVSERHALDAIERARRTRLAATAGTQAALHATAGKYALLAGPAAEGAALATVGITERAYSREAELEADQAALALLARAGYPAAALRQLLQRLAADQTPLTLGFLNSHPSLETRIDQLPVGEPVAPTVARQKRFDEHLSAARS